jgi:[acyl-carrier-protein] S-malonyltransferase
VSAPFHSSLMKPAAERCARSWRTVTLAAPRIPVVNNIDVAKVETDADRIRDALVRQAFGPVRWVESVQAIQTARRGRCIECGPGKVLAGMVQAHRPPTVGAAVYDPATLAEARQGCWDDRKARFS